METPTHPHTTRRLAIAGAVALAAGSAAAAQKTREHTPGKSERDEVLDALHRFWRLVDLQEWELIAKELVVQDLYIDYTSLRPDPPAGLENSAAWLSSVGKRLAQLAGYQHQIFNESVFIEGTEARIQTAGHANHLRKASASDSAPTLWILACQYDLAMRKVDGSWRLTGITCKKLWDTIVKVAS
jgi:hypothetical protein